MTEPKLLTEAEWRSILRQSVNHDVANSIIYNLRERGMIAPEPEPEPVDPLLIEAREICVKYFTSRNYSQTVIDGLCDDDAIVQVALTALRRNLELAERPTLTREMVEEVVEIALRLTPLRETFVDHLHAALVERLK